MSGWHVVDAWEGADGVAEAKRQQSYLMLSADLRNRVVARDEWDAALDRPRERKVYTFAHLGLCVHVCMWWWVWCVSCVCVLIVWCVVGDDGAGQIR